MASSISIWRRLRRTPYQAIAATFMMFITLFVMSVFLLLIAGSGAILTYFESKPQLTVFLKDQQDQTAVDRLMAKLKATGKVADMQYISKDQALSIYREQNKNDPLLLEMVTSDILPSSLDVSATTPTYLAELAETVKNDPAVDEVIFQKDVVDTLISWTTTLRKVGFAIVVVLLVSTFLILLTSIGMKIALRKDEIEILRLVGATSWYIKRPFIFEGILYGFAGATISWAIISVGMLYANPFITSFLRGIPSLPIFRVSTFALNVWPPSFLLYSLLWFFMVLSGVTIGFLGSLFATSRYMKN
jgi:cell division transport system permease protein